MDLGVDRRKDPTKGVSHLMIHPNELKERGTVPGPDFVGVVV